MTATAKFYTGFAIVLAIIVSVSFAVGYRVGFAHALHAPAARAASTRASLK